MEKDWPEEDGIGAMDGFHEITDPEFEYQNQPVSPTIRCQRCGCWLNSRNNDGQYCAPCLERMRRYGRSCGMCGEIFYPESSETVRCPECEAEYRAEACVCVTCGTEFLPYVCVACKDKPRLDTVCHSCHWRETHAEEAAAKERICRVCGCRFLPRLCIVPECRQKLTDICSVCHEEIYHMSMNATVWTLPDCPKCHAVIETLERQHRQVNCLSLEKLSKGDEPDIDAMAHLAMTGGVAPLVFIDGRFLEPDEVEALIGSEEDK